MKRKPQPYFRKQKNAWYVQLNGRRISLGRDEEEAWQKYYELMATKAPIEESELTVAQLLERYLDWVQANRKPNTYKRVRRFLSQFAKSVGHHTKATSISGADLTNWVESEKGWNSTTRADGITAVVRSFNWACERKHLTNPIGKIPNRPRRKRRETVFSVDDWKQLRGLVKDQPFGDLLDFMYETGCRPIEARTIEARHIDLKNSVVVLPPSEAKGERHERVIFLSEKAVDICKRRMHEFPIGPIMRNTKKRPWNKNSVNCRFHRLKKKFNKNCHAYAVRHTFATSALTSGMDSLTVAQLMGHASTDTLAKTYAHLARNPNYLREQARKLRPSDY